MLQIAWKEKNKRKDCGSQFLLKPCPNKIPDETKQLIEELLLEKISFTGISRITKMFKWINIL